MFRIEYFFLRGVTIIAVIGLFTLFRGEIKVADYLETKNIKVVLWRMNRWKNMPQNLEAFVCHINILRIRI